MVVAVPFQWRPPSVSGRWLVAIVDVQRVGSVCRCVHVGCETYRRARFCAKTRAVCAIRMVAAVAAIRFSPLGVWLIPLAAACYWLAPHGAADTRWGTEPIVSEPSPAIGGAAAIGGRPWW